MAITGLYIKDVELYNALRHAIKNLWFDKFSEALSYGVIVTKSMEHFKNSLEKDEVTNDSKNQKYCRTGFSR